MRNLEKVIFLITFLTFTLTISQIVRAQIAVDYLDLPEHTMPMGIVYDDDETIYIASYSRGSIFAINTTTKEYEEHFVRGVEDNSLGLWVLTVDAYGYVWFTENSDKKIGRFIPATKTFREYATEGELPTGILYLDGNVWFTNAPYLSKMNLSTKEITNYEVGGLPYILSLDSSGKSDSSDNIWVSDLGGRIFKFDVSLEKITTEVSGFYRPLGISVHGDLVYVAENLRPADPLEPIPEWFTGNGTVAIYNITSTKITRINTSEITNEGPYMVYIDSYGSLWFTDNSAHTGVIGYSEVGVSGNTTFIDTANNIYDVKGDHVYFLTQVKEKVWFSGEGSPAFIAMVKAKPEKIEFELINPYEVSLDLDFYLEEGSNLVAKFYTYSDTYQGESLVWNDTVPARLMFTKIISHPQGKPIQKVKLVVTNETGDEISTLSSFIVIYPDDDSLVDETPWLNTYNFGNKPAFDIDAMSGEIRRSFLKFNLSEIPSSSSITSAKLRLYCWGGSYGERPDGSWGLDGLDVEIRKVSDDSWNESTLIWLNQPVFNDLLDTVFVDNDYTWYEWNIPSFVQEEIEGDNILSLAAKAENEGFTSYTWSLTFRSKNYWDATFHPHLEITYHNSSYIVAMVDMEPDTLRSKGKGKKITAYIELPEGYDVNDIDISTIRLNDAVSAELKPTKIRDYDQDGIPDLMVKFNLVPIVNLLSLGDVELTITGTLNDGILFEGTDAIKLK